MQLSTDDLIRMGELMHGPNWQSPLARDVTVAVRTMQRWASGKSPIPPDLDETLRAVVRRKIEILQRLLDDLSK